MKYVNKNNYKRLYSSLKVISNLLSSKDRLRIIIASALIAISSILEIAAISTMYPFLVYAFDSKANSSSGAVINFEAILSQFNLSLLNISIIYITFMVFSFALRVAILRITGRYIAYVSNNLASNIFERTIFGTKERLSSQNLISNILLRCNYAMGAFINITRIFADLVLVGGVVYTLLTVDAVITIIGGGSVAACYLLIARLTSKKSLSNGTLIDEKSVLQLKHSDQCLGNFKNIVIEGRIKNEIQRFKDIDILIRLSRLSNYLINSIPRSTVETFIICIIIISVFYISTLGIEITDFLPIIGLYVIAFQKLIPAINSLFINYINIIQSTESLDQLAKQIDDLNFEEKIEYQNFNIYEIELIEISNINEKTKENLYKPISCLIRSGDKVIVSGQSGVGKSTFLESIIGLNSSNKGMVKVNGELINNKNIRTWWNSLSYIPQTGFIFENSLFYNITMSLDDEVCDVGRYKMACTTACLPYKSTDFRKHQGINIAEDGQNLSGGEKQRLLLARALYRMKDVIFLDESLSALDAELRHQILVNLIENFPQMTVFYISHNIDDRTFFEKQINLDR
jgi:ABC-type multidrug transport system fused ATPase/permease subunit